MSHSSVVQDGRLVVPLYHGTSTLFYESIASTGLGGRDIIEELGIREAARLLLRFAEPVPDWPNWSSGYAACVKIAADPREEVLSDNFGMSFRYGGTYMTPSRNCAIRYALLYDCGEALTYVLRLLDEVSASRPEVQAIETFRKLQALRTTPRTPLLIEARGVELSALRTEQGGDCTRAIDQIASVIDDPEMYDVWLDQMNFELVKPLSQKSLRFFELKRREIANAPCEVDRVDIAPFQAAPRAGIQ